MVPAANAGDKVPVLSFSPARFALADGALVIVTVYVCFVTPSWAVTTILMVFGPAFNAIGPDAVLLATVMPFTVRDEAVTSSRAGVTVTELVALGTLEV